MPKVPKVHPVAKARKGQPANQGSQVPQGPQGPSGTAQCPNGECLSLQPTSPGTQETGSINISDNAIIGGNLSAASLSGNGSGISNVNALTLQGNGASYFTNAGNISSGTLNDSQLSANVVLKNTANTLSGTLTLSAPGTALTVANAAQVGSLTVVNAASLGSLTVTGAASFAGNISVAGTVTASSYQKSCPANYVPVPGNLKFGTQDFCVMKYEAKNDGAGNAVSAAAGSPYVSVSQRTAQDKSLAAGGHLISEAEWMTIATNALYQSANWCSLDGSACGNPPGTSGKYLAAGHNDNSPAQALSASSNDAEGCFGTVTDGVNTTCGSAGTQKRTLTLSNGSVIWDFPGNVWDWTDAWVNDNEQPSVDTITDGSLASREYTAINQYKGLQYLNPTNRGWNTVQRIGNVYGYSNATTTTQRGFLRGSNWTNGSGGGAFALNLGNAPTSTSTVIGFRVAR